MFVQTEITPNPNSLKFLPGKIVSNYGSFEVTKKDETNNELIRNLLSINGVEGIFLGKDFISINKYDHIFHFLIEKRAIDQAEQMKVKLRIEAAQCYTSHQTVGVLPFRHRVRSP